jgi:hypothetical protein
MLSKEEKALHKERYVSIYSLINYSSRNIVTKSTLKATQKRRREILTAFKKETLHMVKSLRSKLAQELGMNPPNV